MLHLADVDRMLLSECTWPPGTARAGKSIPIYGYAIRHAEGLILMDSGVGEGSRAIEEWQPRVHSLDAALAALAAHAAGGGMLVTSLELDRPGERILRITLRNPGKHDEIRSWSTRACGRGSPADTTGG